MTRMARKNEIIATLDLGTNKVTMMVAEVGEDGLVVLGIGTAECEGLRKGMVISIGKTVEAIRKARHDAEQMSGYIISDVVAGVGGTHVMGVANNAMVSTNQKEITQSDVRRVLELASTYAMPVEKRVINVLPLQYTVDEHDGIKDPVGMSGVRLNADVHLITANASALENIRKCTERAGLRVIEYVANAYASAMAVLEDNERELGVAVLDIGAGTVDMTIWSQGQLVHTSVLGFGGDVITRDIATGLRTPAACAEELKVNHGLAWSSVATHNETIEVPVVGGRPDKSLSRSALLEIIQPRAMEIFASAFRAIQSTGFDDHLAGGLVLTGGESQIPGLVELADEVMNLPVRLGLPHDVKGMSSMLSNPSLASCYGLAVYAGLGFRRDIPVSMLPVRQGDKPGRFMSFLKKVFRFMS